MAPSQNQQTQKPMNSEGAIEQPQTAYVHELQTVQPAALQAMSKFFSLGCLFLESSFIYNKTNTS